MAGWVNLAQSRSAANLVSPRTSQGEVMSQLFIRYVRREARQVKAVCGPFYAELQ
jgi:hypothetical protein